MSEARIDRITNENNTAGPIISGITTFSGQNFFVPPKGTTAQRPSNCPPGSIRFNTDSAKLEYFDNLQWLEMEAFNVEIGQAGALGNRGVFAGSRASAPTEVKNNIDYVTISTLGNGIDFGDLYVAMREFGACSSSTRGIFGGGFAPSNSNVIQFLTFSSTGNTQDFGDLTSAKRGIGGASSSTRGIFAGGYGPTNVNTVEYITLSSAGNAVSFGSLTDTFRYHDGMNSSTRAVFAGGGSPAEYSTNIIDYVTISTTGNAQDFGDLLTSQTYANANFSNSTRGIVASIGSTNTIEFITIASTGNAQDFGDNIESADLKQGTCSSTRGIVAGGRTPAQTNTISYITILSTGNAIDFGDLSFTQDSGAALSNGHGGL